MPPFRLRGRGRDRGRDRGRGRGRNSPPAMMVPSNFYRPGIDAPPAGSGPGAVVAAIAAGRVSGAAILAGPVARAGPAPAAPARDNDEDEDEDDSEEGGEEVAGPAPAAHVAVAANRRRIHRTRGVRERESDARARIVARDTAEAARVAAVAAKEAVDMAAGLRRSGRTKRTPKRWIDEMP